MTLFEYYLQYMTRICEGSLEAPEGITLTETDEVRRAMELQQQVGAMGIPAFVRACAAAAGDEIPREAYDNFSMDDALSAARALTEQAREEPKEPEQKEPDPDAGKHAFEVFLDCIALDDGLVQYLIEVLKKKDWQEFYKLSRITTKLDLDPNEFLYWLGNKEQYAPREEQVCAAVMDVCLARLAEEERMDVAAALLSGDRKTFELLRCEAPELLHRQAKASMGLWGSSSPSYLILQSLDAANELLADYPEKLQALLPQLESLRRRLAVRGWELLSGEPLKVTLCPKGYGYTGPEVAAALESGGIYPEFYDPDHVVLMVSPQNDPSDLRRLEEVLAALPRRQAIRQGPPPMPRLEQAVTPHEAMLSPWEEVPLEACCGRISAAGALGCPPAVPVVLCGQRMDAAAVEVLRYYGFHRCAVLTE